LDKELTNIISSPLSFGVFFTFKSPDFPQRVLLTSSPQTPRSDFYHTYAPEVTLVSLLPTETVVWIKTKSAGDRFGFDQFT